MWKVEGGHWQQMADEGEYGDEDNSTHFVTLSMTLLMSFMYLQTNWRTDGFIVTKVRWMCV